MRDRSSIRRLAGFALLISAAVTAVPAPAAAHAEVQSSAPAAGAVVGAPPPIVTLRLRGAAATATASVSDGCGQRVPGAVVVAGRRLSIRLAIDHGGVQHEDHSRAGGSWRVDWRVVGTDGHAASGALSFLVGGESRCAQTARPSPEQRTPAPAGADDPGRLVRAGAAAGAAPSTALVAPVFAVAGIGVLLTIVRAMTRRRSSAARTCPRR